MLSAQLVERGAEHPPVREAGQRILRSKSGHMSFGLAPLGDVGESLHEAAVGKPSAANLDDGSVRHLAFADRELPRCSAWSVIPDGSWRRRYRGIAEFAHLGLEFHELIEPRRVLDKVGRQIEQLAAPAVDDGDLQVFGDQHDALAHVLQGELELLCLMPCPRLGPQDSLHGREDDQSEHDARQRIELEGGPGALVDLVVVRADAHPQRIVPDLADGDQTRLAGRAVAVFERGVGAGQHATEQLRAAQILAQSKVSGAAAARADHAIAADKRDRCGRPEIDLVVEFRQVCGIERGHDDAGEAAIAVREAP